MSMFLATDIVHPGQHRMRPFLIAGFFAAAALIYGNVVFLSQLGDCKTVASWKFCTLSSNFVQRALAVIVLSGIYGFSRPRAFDPVLNGRGDGAMAAALRLGIPGVLLVGAPLAASGTPFAGGALLLAVMGWGIGIILLAGSVLRVVAPFPAWVRSFALGGPVLWILLGLALFLPDIGDMLFPIWHMDGVRDVTFAAVVWLSSQIGLMLISDPTGYVLGQGDFFVKVNQSCSGVEGLALTTIFMTGYMALFRKQIRLMRVALILPLALALSWMLNVVRISLLLWIGVNVSPVLAVESFHSHAGWLMFSLLSLAIIASVQSIRWFHRQPAERTPATHTDLPPILKDWNIARIFPFGVFMFTALLASTFFEDPALAYPLRFAAILGALWLFRAHLIDLPWRFSGAAMIAGAGIAAYWIATGNPEQLGEGKSFLAGLSSSFVALWIVTRIVGTTLLVPILEELFFRSYLLERFGASRGTLGVLIAVAVSTIAFAALHDRWLAAAIAGCIFAVLALRPKGHLVDAILAHMVANGAIAVWAALSGNWSMI
ncbi:exosortase E/protease, VPEID-CTERM system [Oceaniovalibus sp. ACAM 378]|uniref:exosortase E/protease, VPEID-CTERM system n=1 Tax=Oceaniovalibus sp. ACAM 378 TaxID=2599923 RepID=UPI0016527C51|nr:exosortase E/protease, VPEID-CTERM system [Oceaniovalibus sp. ACAM 378]